MAYVFNKLVGQVDDNEKAKQDIFAAEGDQSFGLTDSEPQQRLGGQPQTKTDTSFSLAPRASGGGSTQVDQIPPAEKAPRGATEQRQQTINQAKTSFPRGLQSLGEQIGEHEQNLTRAANEYRQKYKQQDFGLDPDTIQGAVSGKDEDLQRVSGLLSGQSSGVIPDRFEVPNVGVDAVSDIQTQGGLEQYLRRQAGPQYTAGESDFDAAALARDPIFQAGRAELGRRQDELNRRSTELGSLLPQEASGDLSTNYGNAQQAAREALTGRQGEITSDINRALSDRQTGLDKAIQDYVNQKALAARGEDYKYNDLLNQLGIDPIDYASNVRSTPISRSEATTAEQAQQYNTIADLLGTGGQAASSTEGSIPEPLAEFNQDAYLAALQQAYNNMLPGSGNVATTGAPIDNTPAVGYQPPYQSGVQSQINDLNMPQSPIPGAPVIPGAPGETLIDLSGGGFGGGPLQVNPINYSQIDIPDTLSPAPSSVPVAQQGYTGAVDIPVASRAEAAMTPEEIERQEAERQARWDNLIGQIT